ncbi:MAG: hypothetical protein JWM87_608 [Candidatus Eremiobacteraeota bacterium]|nr:hypothetical protein [Candidatus Eremiobacteraeota bacterium]
MKTVVVLQPQFFPWRGVFEQIRLADEFVHFDDVQFPQGRSFTSRVQIKTASGPLWLTVPVTRGSGPRRIDEVEIDYGSDWRRKHRQTLAMSYARAPFAAAALAILDDVYAERPRTIADLDIAGIERCSAELGLRTAFTRASSTPVVGAKSERLVALLRPRGATAYVTGLGALDYLEEATFAAAGIDVRVMAYTLRPYSQLQGPFDPYVSILDTIANLGPDAASALDSPAVPWTDAVRDRVVPA